MELKENYWLKYYVRRKLLMIGFGVYVILVSLLVWRVFF